MNNLWQQLPKPIWCLAPMEGVTDTTFRQVVLAAGKPDIMFTEFTNVDGLFSRGRKAVQRSLAFIPEEKPLVAQIWGLKPENYEAAGRLVVEMGFDGVDINMGCPDRNVIKKGACSALVKNRPLAAELIACLKRGVGGKIPVSVKVRIGFDQIETEKWAEFLLRQQIDALIVHGRTTKEKSLVPNRWEEIAKVVTIRNALGVETAVIGNGDVLTLEEAEEKVKSFQVDGVMIGRGIFQDPWLFSAGRKGDARSPLEKIDLLLYHVRLFENVWGTRRPLEVLRRFFKVYLAGFYDAQNMRAELMEAQTYEEIYRLTEKFRTNLEKRSRQI